MSRSVRALALVAVVAVAVVAAACGIPDDAAPSRISPSAVPFHLLDPASAPTTAPITPQVGAREDVYLVDTSQHVIPVIRDVAPPATLTEIMGALLDGTTDAEASAGLQSFLTGKPADVQATVAGGIATVDFATNPFQIVGPDQTLAVAQVVYTAAAQPGVVGVLFQIAGKPIGVPTDGGVQVSGPVTTATYAAEAPVAAGPGP